MHLSFTAKEVSYVDALDGDIVQVTLQEESDPEIDYSKKNSPIPPLMKYILFSANYEFPPCDITVEWSDGKEWGGGLIENIDLTRTSLNVTLNNELRIDVIFETDESTFLDMSRFLIGTEV